MRSDNRCRGVEHSSDIHRIGPKRPIDPSTPAVRPYLWKGALGVALFVLTALLCLLFITPGFDPCRKQFGRDFLAFYAAGTLAREGRHAELYDLGVIRAIERQTARTQGIDLGDAVGPWWNPPGYAWVFAPLSRLSFGTALLFWTGINVAAAIVAAYLLGRIVSPAAGSDRGLVALLLLASAPLIQSLAHGQNSAISLLIVTVAITAWRGGGALVAGACIGLLGYKPQLAAALAVVLVLHRGWRAAAGVLSIGGLVLVATALTMPGALPEYLHRLPQNLHVMQVEQTYLWERHVTLQSFWRLLVLGRGPGETTWTVHLLTVASAAPLLVGLCFATLRGRSADALIAATVAAAPLLMPFYFDYDLLLLAAAGALTQQAGRRSLALWAALYLWLYVNPYVAGAMRANVTVPLLYGLAASLTWNCLRRADAEAPRAQPPAETRALPRAA
jgi:alpha-1,2-mannosyltransferase